MWCDFVDHPSFAQQVECTAVGRSGASAVQTYVLDLLADVARHGEQDGVQVGRIGARSVLREVFTIGADDFGLCLGGRDERSGLAIHVDALGHAANEEIGLQLVQQRALQGLVHRRRMLDDPIGSDLVAHSQQVFPKRHRVEVQVLHAPDRYRDISHDELQQRSGGDHVQLGNLLVEVAQRHDRTRARLHFVEEQQRAPGHDAPPVGPARAGGARYGPSVAAAKASFQRHHEPALPLARMVHQWHAISQALAEPPRRRLSQLSGYFDSDAATRATPCDAATRLLVDMRCRVVIGSYPG